jgi:hypothetical protein
MSTQCLAGRACRAPHVTADGRREGRYLETSDALCDACAAHLRSAIKQLPDDWAQLRDTVGERQISDGPKITSTRTPAMPISARREALMADIVEAAARAAEIVSDALNTDSPAPRHGRRGYPPHEAHTVQAAIRLIEPNLNKLALYGANVPEDGEDPDDRLHVVWHEDGERRGFLRFTGMTLALQLADLHNQTRAELGKTRLRERFAMPCPQCGGRVGRDDGQTIVNCDDCDGAWTERDYKWFAGLIIDERRKMEIIELLKWLLAESYSRLDRITKVLDTLTDEDLALTGSGIIVKAAVMQRIEGHLPPENRPISSEPEDAEQRQVDEDEASWEWGERPQRYTPPKRKRTQQKPPPQHPVHPQSLSTLIDLETVVINGCSACPDCNLVHAGECP